MRIIPRNTKVATEFFTGVSLADIAVGAVGILLVFLVVVSNLPYKLGICGTITAIFILLLVRIDTEANYMFLLRIVKHFSYYRSYRKIRTNSFMTSEKDFTGSASTDDQNTGKKKKEKKKKRNLKEQYGHEEKAVESLSV